MARKRRKRVYPDGAIDWTPMIDVGFELMIFFVFAVSAQDSSIDASIRLALAPHGPVQEQKDPRTITIEIKDNGVFSINRTPLDHEMLVRVLRKAVAEYGQSTPIVIRGDANVPHEYVRQVMDSCGRVGLWKLRLAALKEQSS